MDLDQISERERIYLAGFFDGEGYVSILAQPDRHSGRRSHVLHVAVSNVYRPALEELQAIWGGGWRVMPPPPERETWQTVYQLYWGWAAGARVLRAIQPYLRVKQEAVRIALALAERKQSRKVTPEEWEIREDLRMELRTQTINRNKHTTLDRLPFPKPADTCARCGDRFYPHKGSRYCSPKCRLADYYRDHKEKWDRKRQRATP